MINQIKSEGVNIVTVEDPVEYRIPGHRPGAGAGEAGTDLRLGAALDPAPGPERRAGGRDPRPETAQIAVQASLTGHLVLSTLHTNDAANADHPAGGHRGRGVQDRGRAARRDRPAPDAQAVQYLQGSLGGGAARPAEEVDPARHAVVPRGRLPRLRHDGLPGPLRHPRGAHDHARGRAAHRRGGDRRPDRGCGAPRGDAVAVGQRPRPRPARRVDGRRSDARGGRAARRGSELRRPPPPRSRRGRSGGASATAAAARPSPRCRHGAGPAEPFGAGFELLDETRGRAAVGPARGGPTRKVLLVDDEDSLRKVLKDLLERDGYEVSEARDGVQALDQVDRVGPDIVVLDLNLPALDGYGVLSQLRSRPATAGIPVIVLTAKGDEDNEVRVFELGADDFLQKPFRARALSARLEAVLGRRRPPVTAIRVCFVDTLVLRGAGERLEVLVLRRAPGGRNPGSWETVHGTIESGETPVQASLRELREETGSRPGALLQPESHRRLLPAPDRRACDHSGVRGVRGGRCRAAPLRRARCVRLARAGRRRASIRVAAGAKSARRRFVNSGGGGWGLAGRPAAGILAGVLHAV